MVQKMYDIDGHRSPGYTARIGEFLRTNRYRLIACLLYYSQRSVI